MNYVINALVLASTPAEAESIAEQIRSVSPHTTSKVDGRIVRVQKVATIETRASESQPLSDNYLHSVILEEIKKREEFEKMLSQMFNAKYTVYDACYEGEITPETHCKAMGEETVLEHICVAEKYISAIEREVESYPYLSALNDVVKLAKLALTNTHFKN